MRVDWLASRDYLKKKKKCFTFLYLHCIVLYGVHHG